MSDAMHFRRKLTILLRRCFYTSTWCSCVIFKIKIFAVLRNVQLRNCTKIKTHIERVYVSIIMWNIHGCDTCYKTFPYCTDGIYWIGCCSWIWMKFRETSIRTKEIDFSLENHLELTNLCQFEGTVRNWLRWAFVVL